VERDGERWRGLGRGREGGWGVRSSNFGSRMKQPGANFLGGHGGGIKTDKLSITSFCSISYSHWSFKNEF
jgi:hypothetical protein